MQRRKNTRKTIVSEEIRNTVIELRKQGMNYADIANEVGIHMDTARSAVNTYMIRLQARTLESADELRRDDYSKLSMMLDAIWDRVLEGELGAIDRAIKILERRARLMGLDMQQQNAILMALNLERLTDEQLEQIATGANPLQVLANSGVEPEINMSSYKRSLKSDDEVLDASFVPLDEGGGE